MKTFLVITIITLLFLVPPKRPNKVYVQTTARQEFVIEDSFAIKQKQIEFLKQQALRSNRELSKAIKEVVITNKQYANMETNMVRQKSD